MSWLPLPDPRYPTCKMGINDLYLFPGSLGERALPTEMLFAVILTNWTLVQRRVQARPQDPSSEITISQANGAASPSLCPHASTSFLLQTRWKGRVGLRSQRGRRELSADWC